MQTSENIEYDVDAGIAEIALNRPDVLNAFTPDMLLELNEVIQQAHDDDDVYAIVLTGRGRGFCTGADMRSMNGREDRERRVTYGAHLWQVQNIDRLLYQGPKPTIGAINGPAVGAGCDFALSCDLRLVSPDAMFRQQFVNIGLVPGDGGAWLLPRLVGEAKAKEYILTGRDIPAEEAVDVGLAMELVEDDLLSRARELAADLRDKPRTAMRNAKSLIDTAQSFEDYAYAAFDAQWECVHDPEHKEAVSAFTEGRDPDFDRSY